jgi:hypothetical protein
MELFKSPNSIETMPSALCPAGGKQNAGKIYGLKIKLLKFIVVLHVQYVLNYTFTITTTMNYKTLAKVVKPVGTGVVLLLEKEQSIYLQRSTVFFYIK